MNLPIVTPKELAAALDPIKRALSEILEYQKAKQPEQTEFISRKEAAKLVGVTLPALDTWTKRGILTRYKIGGRIRYDRNELINAVKNPGQ